MGEVHLACSHGAAGFEKLVAIKVLKATLLDDARQVQSLLDEARLGVLLEHENIVQVLDLGEELDHYFIVMEYVRGFSLAKVLSHLRETGQRMSHRGAAHIARTLTRALDYLHECALPNRPAGLVHGDVSAANVLLGATGRIALGDFGVAALLRERPEQMAGKWSYLPPEAFRGERAEPGWDVYALGALLYEMLAGEKAFKASSMAERADELAEPPFLADRGLCPPELAQVVARALAPASEQRFASARDLRRALDAAAPPTGEDPDEHQAFVTGLFADPGFVGAHGELPSTSSGSQSSDPYLEDTEAVTVGPRLTKPLRLGLSPAHGAELCKEYGERLASMLGVPLGRPVRAVTLGDYQTLVECLLRGDVDIAWMPPIPFARAASRGAGLVAVARRGGAAAYTGVIVARVDGPGSIDELRGRSVAWVDRESASGYFYPRRAIEDVLGGADCLGRESFHGSHRAVCEAVANGWTAAGATYAAVDADGVLMSCGFRDLLPERADELHVIGRSRAIPGDNIAHRPQLSAVLVRELRSLFVGLHASEAGHEIVSGVFRADCFVAGDIDSYDELAAL